MKNNQEKKKKWRSWLKLVTSEHFHISSSIRPCLHIVLSFMSLKNAAIHVYHLSLKLLFSGCAELKKKFLAIYTSRTLILSFIYGNKVHILLSDTRKFLTKFFCDTSSLTEIELSDWPTWGLGIQTAGTLHNQRGHPSEHIARHTKPGANTLSLSNA
jgi:hypothetical protein